MIHLKIEIDDIDYEQIISRFLPDIIQNIPKNESTKILMETLDILGDDVHLVAKNLLSSLQNEKKEALLKLFASTYEKEICRFINELVVKNELSMRVTNLNLS